MFTHPEHLISHPTCWVYVMFGWHFIAFHVILYLCHTDFVSNMSIDSGLWNVNLSAIRCFKFLISVLLIMLNLLFVGWLLSLSMQYTNSWQKTVGTELSRTQKIAALELETVFQTLHNMYIYVYICLYMFITCKWSLCVVAVYCCDNKVYRIVSYRHILWN